MYRTVIFDLDGTVLDTLQDLANSVNFSLQKNGLPLRTVAEIKTFVGNGIGNLLLKSLGQTEQDDLYQQVYRDFKAHYALHSADNTTPYRGITELLTRLKQQNIQTAVVSNKTDDAVKPLVQKYFNGLFDYAVGEIKGISRKPAPDLVNLALKHLGASKQGAVYIGDSEVDILTAENADLPVISVLWGFREQAFLQKHGAKQFAHTVEQLGEMLLS